MFINYFKVLFFILLINQAYSSEQEPQNYSFTGVNDFKIVYSKFGNQKGVNGSLVISPGRAESSLKHTETALDFIKLGFSPVYIINHRGQGFSQRALSNSHKGYVEDFNFYHHDFNSFIQKVLDDPDTDSENLFALSHSMGGAILVSFLQHHKNPFKAVSMVAPMLGIKLDSEDTTLFQTWVICYTPFAGECNDYVPGGKDYKSSDVSFNDNKSTHSFERFQVKYDLWERYPELQLGSATVRWVRESIQANQFMREKKKIEKIKDIPIFILQAELDEVVENSMQNLFCDRKNKVGKKNCDLIVIPGSRHGVLIETDEIRQPAIDFIDAYFKSFKK
ncbi:MAG: alpha/beta fold hydrolase [Bdellovibrionota bacterium]|nr:alpha/beta fold hydrolase [Bdellovibrionota bacterium]